MDNLKTEFQRLRAKRDRAMALLRAQKWSDVDIAKRYGISPERVAQILGRSGNRGGARPRGPRNGKAQA